MTFQLRLVMYYLLTNIRGVIMTIPTDIILAFILLVIFNFAMNLFLFYKWHKLIEEYNKLDKYVRDVDLP